MTLHIIGTGFGRTGTDSMRNALNILGVGPTHHMLEIVEDGPERKRWLDLAKGASPDWEALFRGYRACVDWPSAFYWRTLIDVYPDAKVLLTMRSAESWWSSFEKTILKLILTDDDTEGFGHLLIAEQVFGGRPDDREHAIKVYNQNVEEVLSTVSADRLLVHNLGDGWGPLCDWLGLDFPDCDYPSGNTSRDFVERFMARIQKD